jgi:pimeloyl-ACP methyl ester carboxylesterase
MEICVRNNIFLRRSQAARARADIWFLPALGESSLCFREAFESKLGVSHNLFAVDVPGFGVSPPNPRAQDVPGVAQVLLEQIGSYSSTRPVVLVAHSMMSLVAQYLVLSQQLEVDWLISVEGNLTRDDTFLSGLAVNYPDPHSFYTAFIGKILALLGQDRALRCHGEQALHRYYASVRFADPQTMWLLGQSGFAETGEELGGRGFLELSVKKLYVWDEASTSVRSKQFIQGNEVPNRVLSGLGHWPMVKRPETFYNILAEILDAHST